MEHDVHVEIYEDEDEFRQAGEPRGVLFISDNPEGACMRSLAQRKASTDHLLPFVYYSESPSPERIVAAMRAGALDYLQSPFESRLLRGLLQRLTSGNDRVLRQEILRSEAKSQVRGLSRREREVLACLVRGQSSKQIGKRLGISSRTVEVHRANLMTKLRANSLSDAVRVGLYAEVDEAIDCYDFPAVA
jgi:FixJ family two-component response regulator